MATPLIIGTNGYVVAIDQATGDELWRTLVRKGILGSSGQDVSVIIADGAVFAGSHGELFCLDLQSGEIRWKNELKGMGYNDVALAIEGVSIQYLQKVVRQQS